MASSGFVGTSFRRPTRMVGISPVSVCWYASQREMPSTSAALSTVIVSFGSWASGMGRTSPPTESPEGVLAATRGESAGTHVFDAVNVGADSQTDRYTLAGSPSGDLPPGSPLGEPASVYLRVRCANEGCAAPKT